MFSRPCWQMLAKVNDISLVLHLNIYCSPVITTLGNSGCHSRSYTGFFKACCHQEVGKRSLSICTCETGGAKLADLVTTYKASWPGIIAVKIIITTQANWECSSQT